MFYVVMNTLIVALIAMAVFFKVQSDKKSGDAGWGYIVLIFGPLVIAVVLAVFEGIVYLVENL